MFVFLLDVNKYAQAEREAHDQSTRSFNFIGIPLPEKPVTYSKKRTQHQCFSVLWYLKLSSGPLLCSKRQPFFVFTRHSKQIQTSRHSDRVEAFDWLSMGAFVYQPIRMLYFSYHFCAEFPYFCTEVPYFCIEFTKNCISLSQSDSRNVFLYIIIEDIRKQLKRSLSGSSFGCARRLIRAEVIKEWIQ